MLTVQAMYIYVCGLSPYKLDPPSPSNVYLCLWSVSLQTGPIQSQHFSGNHSYIKSQSNLSHGLHLDSRYVTESLPQ